MKNIFKIFGALALTITVVSCGSSNVYGDNGKSFRAQMVEFTDKAEIYRAPMVMFTEIWCFNQKWFFYGNHRR